jgi:hypothetical protein
LLRQRPASTVSSIPTVPVYVPGACGTATAVCYSLAYSCTLLHNGFSITKSLYRAYNPSLRSSSHASLYPNLIAALAQANPNCRSSVYPCTSLPCTYKA